MAAYVGGDETAFRQIFDRYAPRFMRMLRRYAADESECRDLVQQTFLQMHRARLDFRGSMHLRPWLTTIALNLGRDAVRRRGRKQEQELAMEPVTSAPRPDEVAATRQQSARLHKALEALPREQRDAVVMHWFGGLSFPEIAEITESKLNAVKVRAHRAYKRLRKEIES